MWSYYTFKFIAQILLNLHNFYKNIQNGIGIVKRKFRRFQAKLAKFGNER